MALDYTQQTTVISGLLNEEIGADPVPGDPNLWADLGVFGGLSKPISNYPNSHILSQQTTGMRYMGG